MKTYRKINNCIEKVIGAVIAVFLAVMVIVVSIQVIFRYFLNTGLIWSEELARFTNIWLVIMGAAIAFYQRSHVRISLMEEVFKGQRWIFHFIQDLVVLSFSCAMTYYGFTYLEMAQKSVSAGIQINMGWIYLAFPVCGIAMILFSVFNVIDRILEKTGSTGREDTL